MSFSLSFVLAANLSSISLILFWSRMLSTLDSDSFLLTWIFSIFSYSSFTFTFHYNFCLKVLETVLISRLDATLKFL